MDIKLLVILHWSLECVWEVHGSSRFIFSLILEWSSRRIAASTYALFVEKIMAFWCCLDPIRLSTPYHTEEEVQDRSWKNSKDPKQWYFGLVIKLHHDNVFVGNFWDQNQRQSHFSVKDDYLAIGNGPETIENHDTKKLAGICFWQAIRNAWFCLS